MNSKPSVWQWLLLIVVSAVLVWALIANVGVYGIQYQQFNQELTRKRSEVRLPGEYKYVVDTSTKQYWPNEPRYANRIDSANRVWVEDDEGIRKFKGYKPGPK